MAKKNKRKKNRLPAHQPAAVAPNDSISQAKAISAPERPEPAPPAAPPVEPPASVAQAVARAQEMARQGQGTQAMDMLENLSHQHPRDPELLQALGKLYMDRQIYDKAAEVFQTLAEDVLCDSGSYNALALALAMGGQPQRAVRQMRLAVEREPDNHTLLGNLGKIYMMQGSWHLGQVFLERALHAAPPDQRWKHQEVLNQCLDLAKKAEATSSNPYQAKTGEAQDSPLPGQVPAAPQPAMAQPAPQPAPEPAPEPAWTARPVSEPPASASAPVVPAMSAAPAALAVAEQPEPAEAPASEPVAPEPLARTARPLNILFVQEAPCIRNYKLATALSQRGHRVTLAYSQARLSQMYPGLSDEVYADCLRISSHAGLWELSARYDLVHCHNEPDVMTVAALAGKRPVIHDTHDLISLRANGEPNLTFFEGVANRGADGRIYTTPYQLEEAKRLYGVAGPSLVHYNYASAEDLPGRFLPKLSDQDGRFHLVYEGGIGLEGHRDFSELFIELAQGGVVIHIYPAGFNPKVAQVFAGHPDIHYNQPLSPKQIMEEMTRFDAGIIPFNLQKGNKRFLDSTIANKLFEYLAAGLPVAASPLQSYVDYFRDNPVGLTFNNARDLLSSLDRLKEIAAATDFSRQVFTHESRVAKLEEFYYQVIDRTRSKARLHAVPKAAPESAGQKEKGGPAPDQTQDAALNAAQALTAWLDQNGWEGWDPYDLPEYLVNQARQGHPLSENEQRELQVQENQDPLGLRRRLGFKPRRIAKGLGLITAARVKLYKVTGDQAHLDEARRLADWLLANPSPGYQNLCWGYPFDWQSVVFIPKGTPSAVVSTAVGEGLWELYSVTREEKYLEACRSICRFILTDLNCDDMGDQGICFSYTPLDDFHVHNANLFCGEFLARVGRECDQAEWLETAARTADYALSEQNPDGSIYYWGRVQDEYAPHKLDIYHSGFEIRALHKLARHLRSEKIDQAANRYLEFFLANYLMEDGTPKLTPQAPYPVNIHGAAEVVLMLSALSRQRPELLETATRTLDWTIAHLGSPEGWFGYIWTPQGRVMIPHLRWGQAWMLLALAEHLAAGKVASGEWGHRDELGPKPGVKASVTPISSKRAPAGPAGAKPQGTAPDAAKAQIMMPDTGGAAYGSTAWAEALFKGADEDPWGHDWRASQQARYQAALEMLSQGVEASRVKSVLDVGCALGHFTAEVAGRFPGARVLGVDISAEAVAKCRKRLPELEFSQAKLPELTLAGGPFDLVTALEVVYYVGEENIDASLARLAELIRPGGYLLISTYLNKPPFHTPANFRKRVEQYFRVRNEKLRYHGLYSRLETQARALMHDLRQLASISGQSAQDKVENLVTAGVEVLGEMALVKTADEYAKKQMGDKALSHCILLATRP